MFQPRPARRAATSRVSSGARPTIFAAAFVVAAATVALGLIAAPASAAPYSITRCTYSKLPTSPAGTRSPVQTAQGTVPNDLCGDGFGYRFDFSNHTLNTSASGRTGVRFTLAPSTPDLTILSVSARLTLLDKTGDAKSTGTLAFVDETNAGATGTIATWGGGATPQIGPADFTTPASWKPSRSVLLGATCASTCTFGTSAERDLKIEKLTFILDDPSAPAEPTFMASGLLAPGAVQGLQTLSLDAADDGSGVERVEVLTPAGALLAATIAKDGCAYNYAEACPPRRSFAVPVDTSRLVPGTQRLSVRIFNGAGEARTVDTPAFTIPGAPAPTTKAEPARNGDSLGAASITATKGTAWAKTRTDLAYGKTLRLRGRLLDRANGPMAGVDLDLLTTPLTAGAKPTVAATITTDQRGRYDHRYVVKAAGRLQLAYAVHRGAGDYEASRSLAISVVPNVVLGAPKAGARRGAKVTFRGGIAFDPQPPAGTPIGIQVLRRGRWETIDVVTIRDRGRFSWTHRFATRGTYRFRARTFKSAALPTATSSAARLRVR